MYSHVCGVSGLEGCLPIHPEQAASSTAAGAASIPATLLQDDGATGDLEEFDPARSSTRVADDSPFMIAPLAPCSETKS